MSVLARLKEAFRRWQAARQARRRALRALQEGASSRLDALRALRAHRLSPRELEVVAACLEDPDPFIRWEAAHTLAAQERKHVLGLCLRRVQAREPAPAVAAALWTLALLADERAMAALVPLVDHSDLEVRVNLVAALAALSGRPEAQAALQLLLHDPHPTVRRAAVWALKRLNAPWAGQALAQRAQEETHPWVRHVLNTALSAEGRVGEGPASA